jgi:hypothetical protein
MKAHHDLVGSSSVHPFAMFARSTSAGNLLFHI